MRGATWDPGVNHPARAGVFAGELGPKAGKGKLSPYCWNQGLDSR